MHVPPTVMHPSGPDPVWTSGLLFDPVARFEASRASPVSTPSRLTAVAAALLVLPAKVTLTSAALAVGVILYQTSTFVREVASAEPTIGVSASLTPAASQVTPVTSISAVELSDAITTTTRTSVPESTV